MTSEASDHRGAEFGSVAAAFAEVAEGTLTSGMSSHIASGDLERVLTAALKLYAAKAATEPTPAPPVSADKITPTEVVVMVSELMRAANLNLFDLSMWYRRASTPGGKPA
jgi:hypothetical protein